MTCRIMEMLVGRDLLGWSRETCCSRWDCDLIISMYGYCATSVGDLLKWRCVFCCQVMSLWLLPFLLWLPVLRRIWLCLPHECSLHHHRLLKLILLQQIELKSPVAPNAQCSRPWTSWSFSAPPLQFLDILLQRGDPNPSCPLSLFP